MADETRLSAGALKNVHVLVTRPVHQAEHLCRLITRAGGEAIRFPVVEILDTADKETLFGIVDRLAEFDLAIFISPNAVTQAVPLIQARRGGLPASLQVACVGRGTARELGRFGIPSPIVPQGRFDSESLLALPALNQVREKNVVIFRGDGGRELLGKTLTRRGARVTYAECYRRGLPRLDVKPVLQRWERSGIDIITVTSSQGLRNLYEMVSEAGRQRLIHTPLVVLSARQAEVARQLGFMTEPLIAEEASDEAIVAAIQAWRRVRDAVTKP